MTLPAVLRKFVDACAEAGELAVLHGTPKRARKLAIVVDSLLVVINQWEAITGSSPKRLLRDCLPVPHGKQKDQDVHLKAGNDPEYLPYLHQARPHW
jgi:hypothetical protein